MKSHLRTDSATLRKKPGPLQSHIHSFATLLANRGYSRKSIVERIRVEKRTGLCRVGEGPVPSTRQQ
jgi:hypothetical protein